jgi:hypothetical protein
MATTTTRTEGPIPADYSDWLAGDPWRAGSTNDKGGIYNANRVRAGHDKIRALDINQLREQLELLLAHTHEFEDESGGGGTTTCG